MSQGTDLTYPCSSKEHDPDNNGNGVARAHLRCVRQAQGERGRRPNVCRRKEVRFADFSVFLFFFFLSFFLETSEGACRLSGD